jgi:AcrR family transcriptional regulator
MIERVAGRRTDEQARQTRAAVIERAVDLASVEGLEGLTLGKLATELGLSKAGVVGPFGSKEGLQLAALDSATSSFRRHVWNPVADQPAGRDRLLAACQRWIDYLADCPLPGGCFFTTASVEWDARSGPVREAIATAQRRWLRTLQSEADVAIRAGELPAASDPAQLALELNGVSMSLNQALQLLDDRAAISRARSAVQRLLAVPPA